MKMKLFISFDYENDKEVKGDMISQSKQPNFPFEIVDLSINEAVDEKWKEYARKQIRKSDVVIFMCGRYTDHAKGVSAEMSITKEEKKPYFLLKGRRKGEVEKPQGALSTDLVHKWTWKNLNRLILGL